MKEGMINWRFHLLHGRKEDGCQKRESPTRSGRLNRSIYHPSLHVPTSLTPVVQTAGSC